MATFPEDRQFFATRAHALRCASQVLEHQQGTQTTTTTTTTTHHQNYNRKNFRTCECSAHAHARGFGHAHAQSQAQEQAHAQLSFAVGINSVGVALLEANEPDLAADVLKNAIDALARSTSPPQQEGGYGREEMPMAVKNERDCILALQKFIVRTEARVQERRRRRQDQGAGAARRCAVDPMVYARPVRIRLPHRSSSSLPLPSSSRRAAACGILFNLGLAHHLESCLTGGRRERSEKALSLYGMAEAMILKVEEASLNEGAEPKGVLANHGISVDLLVRALLNNKGQLCLEWGEADVGKKCFKMLQRVTSLSASSRATTEGRFDWFAFNALVAEQMVAAPVA